jgi:hypothetical protein
LGNAVIWRGAPCFVSIGSVRKDLRLKRRKFPASRILRFEVLAMTIQCAAQECFEISPRFRQMVEQRIARLERDADYDEAQLERLDDIDHIRRQMRLVAVERAEALRMRLFLDRARTRPPRPMIAL